MPSKPHRLALGLLAASMFVVAPAAAAADDRVAVCAAELKTTLQPNYEYTGFLKQDQTFEIRKLSDSGKYAYGLAYGHINRLAWVESAGLCRTGDGPHARASVRIVGDRVEVCDPELDVTREPNQGWHGQLERAQSFDVRKLSDSGKYAYGLAYGHINRLGWVETSGLCR